MVAVEDDVDDESLDVEEDDDVSDFFAASVVADFSALTLPDRESLR